MLRSGILTISGISVFRSVRCVMFRVRHMMMAMLHTMDD